jgi:hypothetical protein
MYQFAPDPVRISQMPRAAIDHARAKGLEGFLALFQVFVRLKLRGAIELPTRISTEGEHD